MHTAVVAEEYEERKREEEELTGIKSPSVVNSARFMTLR